MRLQISLDEPLSSPDFLLLPVEPNLTERGLQQDSFIPPADSRCFVIQTGSTSLREDDAIASAILVADVHVTGVVDDG